MMIIFFEGLYISRKLKNIYYNIYIYIFIIYII